MYRRGIMVLVVRGCVGRMRISVSVLLAAMGCALVLTLTGCNGSSRTRWRGAGTVDIGGCAGGWGHGVHVDADDPLPVGSGRLLRQGGIPRRGGGGRGQD